MGAWQEIVDYTVPSNTTSVVLDSFGTITKDDFVKVVITNTADVAVAIYPNNQTTDSNYHVQLLWGNGSSVSAARANVNSMQLGSASSQLTIYLKLSENDRANFFSNSLEPISSSLQTIFAYSTSSGVTFASGITSLTVAARSSQLAAGTRIQIYKLAATKVADITVASNTTQVDISNLSIDKDSEYLLVYYFPKVSTSTTINLVPNDLTTLTGYYRQVIEGAGTGASASRVNNAAITFLSSADANGSNGYAYIKLSNIGAYTAQSYSNRDLGSSNIRLQNFFVSSVAENITSITKLNLVSSTSNMIIAGSRFELYKLY